MQKKRGGQILTIDPYQLHASISATPHQLKQLTPLIVAHRRETWDGIRHWLGLAPEVIAESISIRCHVAVNVGTISLGKDNHSPSPRKHHRLGPLFLADLRIRDHEAVARCINILKDLET